MTDWQVCVFVFVCVRACLWIEEAFLATTAVIISPCPCRLAGSQVEGRRARCCFNEKHQDGLNSDEFGCVCVWRGVETILLHYINCTLSIASFVVCFFSQKVSFYSSSG